jgi:hypothetical protein
MTVPRTNHVATPIGGGKVLITGGTNVNGNSLATAEVFNPASGVNGGFSATTNNMFAARSLHTATVLSDGRVLIVGGFNGSGGVTLVDIYDPSTNSFTSVAPLPASRWLHTATLLPGDTRVLIVGGNSSGPFPVPNGVVYDPGTNTYTPTSEPITNLRSRHVAIPLADGRILVAGGTRFYPALEPVSQIYDKSTNRLDPGPTMVTARMDAVVAGDLIFGGVASDLFGQDGLSDVERYSATPLPNGQFEFAGNLFARRKNHAVVPIGGTQYLVVGGYGAGTLTGRTAEIYGPTPVPTLQPPAAPDGQLNSGYGFSANTSGTSPFTLSIYSNLMPDGVGFTPNMSGSNAVGFSVSGVAVAAGSFPFNVLVGDGFGTQRTQTFRVRIDPIVVTTTQLPPGTNGQLYSQQIQATSTHAPLTFKLVTNTGAEVSSGAGLPTGWSLSNSGLVSGPTTQSGFFSFNVRVTDQLNQSVLTVVSVFIP